VNRHRNDEETARLAREFTARAARRLDYLEWVILAVAVGAAVLGGALVAWLVHDLTGASFRIVWAVSAILLFVVPGGLALRGVKREERAWRARKEEREKEAQERDV
jgi:MFS family permease